MLRTYASRLLPALAIAAIAVTGCGGSSKKASATTPGSAATASTSSGSGTTSTPSGSTGGLNMSSSLNAPLAQRLFRAEGVTHGLPAAVAGKFVACLENKFASQGMRTFGDAASNRSQVRLDSASCALQVRGG